MYFADFDEDSGMYCVFNSETGKDGFAYSSWSSMDQAEKDADERNRVDLKISWEIDKKKKKSK